MAAPSGIKWGSSVSNSSNNNGGKIGIYVKLTNNTNNTVRHIEVWFASKYGVSDSSNTLYWSCGQNVTSATGNQGSTSISHTVSSGNGWSDSNQTKLHEGDYTYSRGDSNVTYKCYAKLTGIETVGGTMSANTTFTVPKKATTTYKVTLNKGTGINTVTGGGNFASGNSVTVKATLNTGYVFNQWKGTNIANSTSQNYTFTMPAKAVTLNASAKLKTYNITYNANGGTGAPAKGTKTHGETYTLSTTKPTRSGYTFNHWNRQPDGSGTTNFKPGGNYTGNEDATFYAQWIANPKYNVTLTKGTGIASVTGAGSYESGASVTVKATLNTGYNFKNWTGTYTNTAQNYTFTMPASAVSLTANGELKTYAVTYNANGGTGAPATQYKTHGVKLTLSKTEPTRANYSFDGWATSAAATYVSYSPGGIYSNDAALNLFAKWSIATYQIDYNANGGSGAPATQYKTHGTNLTLSSTKPSRPGYTFKGWSTSSFSSVIAYQPGATYSTNAAITLYAVWERETYNISYALNGGSVTGNPTTYNVETTTFTLKNPTRTGHTFTGWTGSNGTTPQTTVTISKGSTGDRMYTANWTPGVYTLTYNANGGSGAPSSQTWTYGSTNITLSTTKPTRTGHTFLGWSTSSSATSASYSAGGTVSSTAWSSNTTLYAVWDANSYTATFNANGGTTPSPSTIVKDYGSKLGTLPTTSRTGYTFAGWFTTASGGTQISANTTITGNVTYYAHWTGNPYTLSYNANGGTGAPSAQTWTYGGTAITVSSTTPTRTGYTFKGWSTSSTATTASYSAGGTISSTTWAANTTLYAVWEAVSYSITYNLNSGSVTGNPTTYTIETANFTLKNPTRTGYTFTGWTGTGLTSASTSVTVSKGSTGNRSYTANWQANIYTLSYNANGGSGAPASQTWTYGGNNIKLSSTTPTRTGYTFLGWSVSSTATSAEYPINTTLSSTIWASDKTLYAVWDPNKYTVSFNANGGSGAPSAQTKTYGQTLTLSSAKPTRSGYTFKGWGTSSTTETVSYQPGGSYTTNAAITLYAVWVKNSDGKIYFCSNGRIYAKGFKTGSSISADSSGYLYAASFVTGTSIAFKTNGQITATAFIEGMPENT